MRIIETIEHHSYLVSIFVSNQRWILKIANGDLEQTYRFSQEEFMSTELLKSNLTDTFYQGVESIFLTMAVNKPRGQKNIDQHDEEII